MKRRVIQQKGRGTDLCDEAIGTAQGGSPGSPGLPRRLDRALLMAVVALNRLVSRAFRKHTNAKALTTVEHTQVSLMTPTDLGTV